eukprot:scaffold131651_cov30-Phaeocystis_antarctica.AAC.1
MADAPTARECALALVGLGHSLAQLHGLPHAQLRSLAAQLSLPTHLAETFVERAVAAAAAAVEAAAAAAVEAEAAAAAVEAEAEAEATRQAAAAEALQAAE